MFRSFASLVLLTLCAALYWPTVISGGIFFGLGSSGKPNNKRLDAPTIKLQMTDLLSEINCGSCGDLDQPPCSQDVNETCVYWPFNLSIDQATEPVCEKHPTCPPGLTCNPFWVFTEYNENGTKAAGVCDKYLTVNVCAKGLPLDAMPDYEVIIKNGKAYYKSTDTLVNTWKVGDDPGTLYVIDARNEKIYMVNVHNRRFMEVRGSANCLDRVIPQGGSTYNCTIPRICNHAGIIMASLATETPHDRFYVTLIGVGMVDVIDGEIQWISNESGHFKPPQDILCNVVDFLKRAGVKSFDDCLYKFENHPKKNWLFVQHKCKSKRK